MTLHSNRVAGSWVFSDDSGNVWNVYDNGIVTGPKEFDPKYSQDDSDMD
ncbi:hypothetical protein [Pediococcus pentosaceus]